MNSNHAEPTTGETPLQSWKEIGAYLQRNEVTARRWEKEEGLPIHRHSHKSRSSVYAYPSEIESWKVSRKAVPESAPVPVGTFWRVPTFAMAILLCLVMVGNGIRPQVASAKSGPLAKRLVCTHCGDEESRLSRDGHWLAFTDWSNGALAVREITSGQVKQLLKFDLENGDLEQPVLSPDRRQIIYTWENVENGHYQLRLVANEPGSKPRVLIDSAEYSYYDAREWFPDGKSVLVDLFKDRITQLARVSVSDGAVKVLKPLALRTSGDGSMASVSPDGRYIVYSALTVNPSKVPLAPTDSKDKHIYLMSADGSGETEIVKTAGRNRNPVWTPDGKHILFTSDRSGTADLWSIAVQEGKAAGSASLVSGEIGEIFAVGVVNGSYYYQHRQQGEYVHMVGVTPSGSAPVADAFSGIRPTWSPDGKSVAFKRHHPGSDRYDMVIHSLETGEEKSLLAGIGTTGNGRPMWFHDGMSIMTGVKRGDGPSVLTRVDLKTGEFKELHVITGVSALSLDDKTLYVAPEGNAPSRVVAVDIETGRERVVLASLPSRAGIALSPDGRTLALGWLEVKNDGARRNVHIARVSVDGSGFREVFTGPDHLGGGNTVAWDRDGRSILFDQQQPGGGNRWGVMRVQAEGGGTAALVFPPPVNIQSFDLSADGARFAYSSNERVLELWALDNVLPMLK